MSAHASITVDLDTTHEYRTIHGLSPRDRAVPDATYILGVTRLLELFEEFGIRGTLFVIGRDTLIEEHQVLLERAVTLGHELGNHTYHHRYDLRMRGRRVIEDDIERGEHAIEYIQGRRPSGFRTPGYNIDNTLFSVIASRGYLYDSSVFPCPPYYAAKGAIMAWKSAVGTPSRSQMTRPDTLLAPITPYRAHADRFWRARPTGMIEVPMCIVPGLRLPVIGTSLHLFGARGFTALMPALRRTYSRLLQLEFHSIDFVDDTDPGVSDLSDVQPDVRIPWPVKRRLYEHVFHTLRRSYTFAPLQEAVRSCFM